MYQQQPPVPPAPPKPSAVKDLFNGAGYFLRGLGWIARRPGQWLFGLIPAVIVLAFYVAGLVLLARNIGALARGVTPFADDWSEGARETVHIIAGITIFGAVVFVALVLFTALTLLVGDPFYEKISERVEESRGGAPPGPDVSLAVSIGRAIKDAVLLGLVALAFGIVFFACGFLPVVGQTVVPVVAALVSGYLLTGELTSVPMERRGLLRRARFARMKANRSLSLGFGAAAFVVFLIPLGAVLAMPGAVAGATLMTRERLGVPPAYPPAGPPSPPVSGPYR
ncbi:EI24 domain-containing protein [Actinomadura atramentaria]|uniref:EI24 domain-containing protein n=1 Tax=Actinomadura atramentaria TaxID=1990 RepID=UPI000372D4B0|nr:EI24 domain-containing protein [Actinomadura atramentaria]